MGKRENVSAPTERPGGRGCSRKTPRKDGVKKSGFAKKKNKLIKQDKNTEESLFKEEFKEHRHKRHISSRQGSNQLTKKREGGTVNTDNVP